MTVSSPTPSVFVPSPQQAAIFTWVSTGRGSARVDAVAGAGKTTTLEQAVKLMRGSIAVAAYNKKIADEISARIGNQPGVRVGTFHSFGFAAIRRAFPKTTVNNKKIQDILVALQMPQSYDAFVTKLLSLGKQHGAGVLWPSTDTARWWGLVEYHELEEELASDGFVSEAQYEVSVETGIEWTKKALAKSIELNPTQIDFDDMIYAPLVHQMKVWENDWVLVDEAQDTNPARRALARKMLKANGRLIAVGDPRQAIYGFTGADADAMDLIENEFNCTRLPLTVTYRCPRAVVNFAKHWVSHIEAHPSAPAGAVTAVDLEDFLDHLDQLTKYDAILCRNTKPLVELAYRLIRRGIGCHVEGKDIGRGLAQLAQRWKITSLQTLQTRLEAFLAKEAERLNAKGQEQKVAALTDRVETLYVLMEALPAGSKVADLVQRIYSIFEDTPDGQPAQSLTLSTVHKAKGREWDRVYLLGRNKFMPSKFARQQWQLVQEDNLCYVAATRAKQHLTEIVVPVKEGK